jgi:hypothetical protein
MFQELPLIDFNRGGSLYDNLLPQLIVGTAALPSQNTCRNRVAGYAEGPLLLEE